MYKLHIRDDAGKTKVVTVKRDKITVGRQEGNTIRLTDRNVSRIHARIVRKDGQIFVEDVSRYGTRVNGLRLKEKKVLSGDDVVVIGDYQLKVESEEKQADTLPATPKAPLKKAKKESSRQEAPTTVEKSVGGVDSTSMINLNDIEQAARKQASKKSRIVADVSTLVAVNTELAGTEYRLSGSKIVIGRTDENDVVVDHRSISRNHARIESKGGRVTIFDLESANGLKINDEFYKQSVLRRGDVIELGHVRMRFVETGETFVYRPEDWSDKSGSSVSPAVDGAKQGGSKLWIVALLVLVAAAGVFAVLWSGSEPADLDKGTSTASSSEESTASKTQPSSSTKTVATKPSSPSTAGEAPAGEKPASLSDRLKKIDSLLDSKNWKDAQVHCGAILDEDESNAKAQSCVEKANIELTTASAYREAGSYVDAGNLTKAWEALAGVNDYVAKSSIRAKIERLQGTVQPRYLEELQGKGKRALKAKRYDAAIRFYQKILKIEADHSVASVGLAKARKAKAEERSTVDTPEVPKAPVDKPKDKDKKPPKEVVKKDPKKDPPKKKVEPPAAADTGGKLTWKEYRRKAAKAGAGRLAVYKEAATKGYADAYFYIGRTCQTQGKKGEAVKAYRKFIRLRPGSAKADQAKQALMALGASF